MLFTVLDVCLCRTCRERNRVLARKTRLRKKFFFESLQRQVAQLAMENDMLKVGRLARWLCPVHSVIECPVFPARASF